VVTEQFSGSRAVGDPVSQAKIYEAQLADELVLVDIERTSDTWPLLTQTLREMSDVLATPVTAGGGIQSLGQVQVLLDHGADKVMINSAAIENPSLVNQAANRFGSQCVVAGIDARKHENGRFLVFGDSGRRESLRSVEAWTAELCERGAGEILITSIDRDGTGSGLDLELVESVLSVSTVPVVASGGCGMANHFVEGFVRGCSGVAAGSFFSRRDQNPIQCRSHVRNAGLPIRVGF